MTGDGVGCIGAWGWAVDAAIAHAPGFCRSLPMLRVILTIVLASLACCSAPAQEQQGCGTPVALGDGWPIAAAENVGTDGTRLCDIEPRLRDPTPMSLFGTKNSFSSSTSPAGTILGARLRHGSILGPQASMIYARSSVTSLLVGTAIDRKLIAGP